jgi:predicted nucleic acid-binding protein
VSLAVAILDTNVFNRLVASKAMRNWIEKHYLDEHLLVATHIQRRELLATKTKHHRFKLLKKFESTVASTLIVESSIWEIVEWGEGKWGATPLFHSMFSQLSYLDRRFKKKSSVSNRQRDVLIAETAVVNNLLLISGDKNLIQVVRSHGGKAKELPQRIDTVQNSCTISPWTRSLIPNSART